MAEPYKKRITVQYTEVAYYDADGEEVGRVRMHDDADYDSSAPEDITEEELEEHRG